MTSHVRVRVKITCERKEDMLLSKNDTQKYNLGESRTVCTDKEVTPGGGG